MSTYKSIHTGERVDNAVTKIPESLPTEDSLIVVKANGSASEYVPRSQVSSDKLDKQTAQTTSDQIYGKLADGSQTMFDLTMGAEPTTIPRRDTAGRVQVADGVSGNDAVNFNQLSAVESSVINSLDKGHIAYVNKENTFTEPQTFSYVQSDNPNLSEYGELGGSSANYSYTEYTDDTHKYYTSGEAYISSFVGRVMVGRSTFDEKGVSKNSIVLDVRKNWIARTEINAERVDGKLGTAVQTYYAYIFPKTYPNQNVTLATIEDLTAQFGALNIQNGSGTKAIQQKQDGTTGTFDFTGKNPNATALDPTLTGQIAYGATGDFAASFGGKSAAQGKRSVSAGTTTIAKGKYSAAFGDNSVALGNDSFTANYQNTSKGQASAAFGSETQSIGAASVTFGKGTITNNDYELACGRFNNSQSGYLFSVGCGSSDTDRRNALWVDEDIAYCRSSNGDTGKIATLSDAENQANIVITKKFLNDDIQLSQNLNVIRSLKVGPDNIFTLAGSGVLFGHHLIANAYRQTVVGRYNSPNNNAFFQVGNGDDENTRKNAFEVWSDGRAKVQTAPVDADDVVRKLELDKKFDKLGGTVTGDMVVNGNFTVQGKTTTVDSETLRVADKLIEVGKGNTAPLTSPAGLITPKYDGTNNGGIVYDHTGTAYVGDITLDSNGNVDVNNSDLQPIATRNATITNDNLVKWDSTNHKLVDAGKSVENLVDKLSASLRSQAYVRNANGEDSGLAYTYTDEGNTLALRNASGQLQVGNPSQDKDATNKSYADNLNARYVSTSILGG